ncbi:MAG TPA: DNA mismatch repair endonuclease MutL [Thermoguttaceae bacterium]|nr:DNA mismatch repair endonuclease MutL [Thermoguttaceae bacterium]
MRIHRLSQALINKIAAGEVIERPASVVKELMENAVDAGATRIHVAVTGGGGEMIRVVDNGCGIAPGELELALTAHATSKLQDADDLFRVGTLGFRGEALASIAEVSHLTLRSRTADDPEGAQIEANGGRLSDVSPCGTPVGTTIEVRNLFFNMPVRRKGLRAAATELGHVKETFTRIALALPQIDFTLAHNDRPVFELSGTDRWRDRIATFFGRELAENLIWVESSQDDVQLSGYVAHPSHSRADNRMQYLFLNCRYIRDRSLQHALREAYRGLLLSGRFPIAFLNLAMPPEAVDVNVHPTKIEVRFHDAGRHYGQLLSTLRTKFLSTDLHVRVRGESEDPTGTVDERHAAALREQLVGWAKGKTAQWDVDAADEGEPDVQRSFEVGGESERRLEMTRLDRAWAPAGAGHGGGRRPDRREDVAPWDAGESDEAARAVAPGQSPPVGSSPRAVQVHNRYLVTENEEGLVVFDQHALHERILYEQLRARVGASQLETQSLLVPEPVDLSAAEAAAVVEHRETLSRLGMSVEPFGGDTVLISGYPAMLANLPPGEVLRELLGPLMTAGHEVKPDELLDDLLHTIACKAAIKAGDRLAPEEITSLLDQRHLVDHAHHCPHGRPTALVFTREELDKRFRRT